MTVATEGQGGAVGLGQFRLAIGALRPRRTLGARHRRDRPFAAMRRLG